MNIDVTIFVPCYNEESNIINTLNTVKDAFHEMDLQYEIIIIDDYSKDDSVEIIRNYCEENPKSPINLITNSYNKGLSYNFAEASFIGKGKYFRQVNGDNDESTENLRNILKYLGKADIIITYHENNTSRTIYRAILSKLFTKIVNFITGNNIYYYNGLALYLRKDVQRWHSRASGFGYQAELTTTLLKLKRTYLQIPTEVQERVTGQSKAISFKNFLSIIHTFFKLSIHRMKYVFIKQ